MEECGQRRRSASEMGEELSQVTGGTLSGRTEDGETARTENDMPLYTKRACDIFVPREVMTQLTAKLRPCESLSSSQRLMR
jgi:hypothetical protein